MTEVAICQLICSLLPALIDLEFTTGAVMEVSHNHSLRATNAKFTKGYNRKCQHYPSNRTKTAATRGQNAQKYIVGLQTQKTIQLNPLKKFAVSRGSIALFKKT